MAPGFKLHYPNTILAVDCRGLPTLAIDCLNIFWHFENQNQKYKLTA